MRSAVSVDSRTRAREREKVGGEERERESCQPASQPAVPALRAPPLCNLPRVPPRRPSSQWCSQPLGVSPRPHRARHRARSRSDCPRHLFRESSPRAVVCDSSVSIVDRSPTLLGLKVSLRKQGTNYTSGPVPSRIPAPSPPFFSSPQRERNPLRISPLLSPL